MTHSDETPTEFWRGLALAFGVSLLVYLLGGLVAVVLLF